MIPFRPSIDRGNIGLFWERFAADPRDAGRKDNETFRKWIAATVALNKKVEKAEKSRLTAYAERVQQVAVSQEQGLTFPLQLRSRLLIGTGAAHLAAGKGLSFHPTLGCAYIPGSALKGLTQAFFDEWVKTTPSESQVEGTKMARRIFGQPERLNGSRRFNEGDVGLGSVIFFDALPLTWPDLSVEILTPHIDNYLVSPQAALSESSDLNLISFLAIAPGVKFQFALSLALPPQNDEESASDCALAAGWLVAALENLGVGAKTKSGYGRFVRL